MAPRPRLALTVRIDSMDIQVEGGTLTANAHERVVSGLLSSYNEVGNTNLGKVSVEPGVITLPGDVTVLTANIDHDRESPRAQFLSVNDTPSGMFAAFRVGTGTEGDELLADIASGKRAKLSAEVRDVIIRGGKIIGGKLFGAAFVEKGAFPSASLLASDVGDGIPDPATPPAADGATEGVVEEDFTDESGKVWHRKTTTTTEKSGDETKTTTVVEISEPAATPDAPKEEETVGKPAATLTAAASLTGGNTPAAAKKGPSFHTMMAALEAVQGGRATPEIVTLLEEQSGASVATLFAALNDVKFDAAVSNLGAVTMQPQWIGELWDGVEYMTTFTDLFGHDTLTSMKINGWEWTVKPEGDEWLGNKTAIPSNTPAGAPYTTNARRWAMGHDIAREYIDFPNASPGFMEAYYRAGAESYKRWVDEQIVAAGVKLAATRVEADNPAGLAIGAGFSALIDGAAEVISAGAIPSFALVETQLWKGMMKTPAKDVLGYLSAALGLKDGQLAGFTIRPTPKLDLGNVLVGAREAVTVYELGETPIRVEAPDMVKGGLDTGLFGYAGLVTHKADALQLVTPYTP
jgi:hypothetical protein